MPFLNQDNHCTLMSWFSSLRPEGGVQAGCPFNTFHSLGETENQQGRKCLAVMCLRVSSNPVALQTLCVSSDRVCWWRENNLGSWCRQIPEWRIAEEATSPFNLERLIVLHQEVITLAASIQWGPFDAIHTRKLASITVCFDIFNNVGEFTLRL